MGKALPELSHHSCSMGDAGEQGERQHAITTLKTQRLEFKLHRQR